MIRIYTLTSSLHDPEQVNRTTVEFLHSLGVEDYSLEGDDFSSFGQPDGLDVIYVRTGGTEGLFRALLPSLCVRGSLVLLASPASNSLPASMEILSYLNQQGLQGEIVHGDGAGARLLELEAVQSARAWLRGKRLGVVGAPSDWLISSLCERETVRSSIGVEIVDIPMQRLLDKYHALPEGSVQEWAGVSCRKGTAQAVENALEGADRIYRALRDIVREENLDGLSLRCFDLLSTVRNTGCLGLARLNAEGFVATCEGDIPAMLSMLLSRAVSGESGFQCNPSRMNPQDGTILFAHCTLPLSMARKYSFDTHFESGIGVGIHGELPEGPVTILKVDGSLERVFAEDATLVRNEYGINLCRTQVLVRLQEGSRAIQEYFLRRPIGNHHILIPGHHARLLRSLLA